MEDFHYINTHKWHSFRNDTHLLRLTDDINILVLTDYIHSYIHMTLILKCTDDTHWWPSLLFGLSNNTHSYLPSTKTNIQACSISFLTMPSYVCGLHRKHSYLLIIDNCTCISQLVFYHIFINNHSNNCSNFLFSYTREGNTSYLSSKRYRYNPYNMEVSNGYRILCCRIWDLIFRCC